MISKAVEAIVIGLLGAIIVIVVSELFFSVVLSPARADPWTPRVRDTVRPPPEEMRHSIVSSLPPLELEEDPSWTSTKQPAL